MNGFVSSGSTFSAFHAEKSHFLEVWNRFFSVFVWSNNDIQWLVSLVLKGNRA